MPPQPSYLDPALWHVRAFGREHYAAGRRYFWDVSQRRRDGSVTIQLTAAGCLPVRFGREALVAEAGSMMLFCNGDDMSYGPLDGLDHEYACRWVSLSGAGLAAHLSAIMQEHGPLLSPGMDHPLVDELQQVMLHGDPDHTAAPTEEAAAIHQFVMSLHNFAERRSHARMRPVDQAIQAVLHRPFSAGSLKEVAARFGVSREHLSRSFQEEVGRGPHDYLAEVRGQRALSLLRQTRLPLADVARLSGYANVHTFARQVRELSGLSPTAYRSQN